MGQVLLWDLLQGQEPVDVAGLWEQRLVFHSELVGVGGGGWFQKGTEGSWV